MGVRGFALKSRFLLVRFGWYHIAAPPSASMPPPQSQVSEGGLTNRMSESIGRKLEDSGGGTSTVGFIGPQVIVADRDGGSCYSEGSICVRAPVDVKRRKPVPILSGSSEVVRACGMSRKILDFEGFRSSCGFNQFPAY